MLGHKLPGGTSKTKAGQGGLVRVALFWMSHCATCIPACVILYHVTGSCKGPIVAFFLVSFSHLYSNLIKHGSKEISGRNYVHETGLSLRAVSRNTCYAWGRLIFPSCYGWNALLFKEFTHKVTNLLWVGRIRLQVTKKLMTTLQNCLASISFLRPTCLLVADQKTRVLWERDCHVLN